MSPPELGHNRETSQRNDFFMMSVGGRDNPIPQMDARTIEDLMRDAAMADAPPPPPVLDVIEELGLYSDSDSDMDSDTDEDVDDLNEEQRRIVVRNATAILLRNMQAHLRFMRVDVHRIEEETGRTARIAAMDTRIADMERMIEAFEDNNIIGMRRNLFL